MRSRSLSAIVLVAGIFPGAVPTRLVAERLELRGGETSLEFNLHVLEDLGLELALRAPTGELGEFVRAVYPAEAPVTLGLRASGGSFEGFDGGSLRHRGGFELRWPGGRLSTSGFVLTPAPPPALFELRVADGTTPFYLDSPHPQYLPTLEQFVFLNMDLRLSDSFALRLGRPEASGAAVGSADVRTGLARSPTPTAMVCESNVDDPDPDPDLYVDVELTGIYELDEVAHDAERVAMAPAVDLRNVGTSDVTWKRPINPDGGGGPDVVGQHPFLAINFYTLLDGVMRQTGRADVKHAFFAANDDCECAGAQTLFVGCTDLYSAVTNYNRTNLAPRDEVTASTASWESMGSHFDGTPVDDIRSHYGVDHADGFEHRLTVATEELETAGAQQFVEAWYVTAGDVDIFNSMGHRGVTPVHTSGWDFTFTDAGLVPGSALDAWVDPAAPPAGAAATVLDTGEGHLELVSSAAALPSGAHRYDFGLMNFDFDRRIRSFTVPLPVGVELASIGFYDGDDDPGNDWQSSVTATEIVWSTPAGDPGMGALDWGTMFNFRLDANAAPIEPLATLGVLEAGAPMQLTAAGKAPGSSLVPVSRLSVAMIGSGGGTVTSLPAGIGCTPDCDELYAPDTPVQLSAAAAAGSALIRWTEGGMPVGTETTEETVLDIDRDLVAVFELCDRLLDPQEVVGSELFEACEVLTAGAGFSVAATGVATLRAGSAVGLDNGFSISVDGGLVVEIDAALLP